MRKPYIAYPKNIQEVGDFKEFVLIKNKYFEELDIPVYISFPDEKIASLFLSYSKAQVKNFYNKTGNIETVGLGNDPMECINDLIKKSNSVSQLN